MSVQVEEQIQRSAEHYYRETLGLPDWPVRTRQRMQREFERIMFERLRLAAGELDGKSVLDLGCGWGGVVLQVAQVAAKAVGIEPDKDRLAIAAELVVRSGLKNAAVSEGIGEALPFDDASFDVVASYQVLEHVQDPARVVAEVHRVLKAGGIFHFNTPNYMSFREPHYKVLWLPLMPKWLARPYLRLRRRNPAFIGHIRYVNPVNVRRMLRAAGFEITDVHERRARVKVDRLVREALHWIPPGTLLNTLTGIAGAIARLPIFLVYILFLNPDQEYIARKRAP